jgi:magnesium-transporting ATPase (P-type)
VLDFVATRRRGEHADAGESAPADKSTDPVAPDAALGDRASMAYSGTLVASGQGAGLVVATGASTELGPISAMVGGVETLTTPLLRQMDAFARRLTIVILAGRRGGRSRFPSSRTRLTPLPRS